MPPILRNEKIYVCNKTNVPLLAKKVQKLPKKLLCFFGIIAVEIHENDGNFA